MVSYYPVSIPAHGIALNMTVESYNGSLDFGLTACRRAVPDVREIADHLRGALDELKGVVLSAAAEHVAEAAAATKRVATRAGAKAIARRKPAAAATTKQDRPANASTAAGNGAAKDASATRRPGARRRRVLQPKAA